ncbi:MAG: hypothetical protein WD079_06105, partial [Phycisphaeraceae bacterium]
MTVETAADAVASRARHRKAVWLLVVALVVLHHDFWWWDTRTLVLGFLPITIAYHMMFSLAAAGLWIYATLFAWPTELEQWADEEADDGGNFLSSPHP